jgi:Protein of unknown function (DUF3611)
MCLALSSDMPAFVVSLPVVRNALLPSAPTSSPWSLGNARVRTSERVHYVAAPRLRRASWLAGLSSTPDPGQDSGSESESNPKLEDRKPGGLFGVARRVFGVGAGTGDADAQSESSSEASYPPVPPERWSADEVDVAAEALSPGGQTASSSAAAPPLSAVGIDVQRASRALWKVGWFTWWVQVVLTVVAAVICSFALIFPGVNARASASAAGTVLAGVGVAVSFVSLFWTYGYTRLAIKLRRGHPRFMERAPDRVRGYLRVAVVLAVSGLVVSLIGLQAIVGTLLARLLGAGIATTPYTTMQSSSGAVGVFGGVQPVDVLVIQATANAMSALVAGLVTAIWLRARVRVWTGENEKSVSNARNGN